MPKPLHNVALFVTCLVDLFRPSVGFAAVKLLRAAGCQVSVPVQTCCGQPAYNAGARGHAKAIGRRTIAAFAGFDYVVAPSGSCAGMIRRHYPDLFADDPVWAARAEDLSARTHELVSFLTDVCGRTRVDARYPDRVTYHDSCSRSDEHGVRDQPRALLATVEGLTLDELEAPETCCGFGGTFCVKYAPVSVEMAARKARAVTVSGASTLLGGDLGCLLNLAGKLKRDGAAVRVRHVAEVLAGETAAPPIGEASA
jgi:L-lactate dehydrogenase complex protein LldE